MIFTNNKYFSPYPLDDERRRKEEDSGYGSNWGTTCTSVLNFETSLIDRLSRMLGYHQPQYFYRK